MIRSMTGFGRKQAPWQDGSVTVEIRSVNHRFLEVACRLPRALTALEDVFKKAVQQRCLAGQCLQRFRCIFGLRLDPGLYLGIFEVLEVSIGVIDFLTVIRIGHRLEGRRRRLLCAERCRVSHVDR